MSSYKKVLNYCNETGKNKINLYTDRGYSKDRYMSRRERKKIISKIISGRLNSPYDNKEYANTNNSYFARTAKKKLCKKIFLGKFN